MPDDYMLEGLTISMRKDADSGLYLFGVPFRDAFVVLGSRTPSVPDLELDANPEPDGGNGSKTKKG